MLKYIQELMSILEKLSHSLVLKFSKNKYSHHLMWFKWVFS